jgi:hypothetical protein
MVPSHLSGLDRPRSLRAVGSAVVVDRSVDGDAVVAAGTRYAESTVFKAMQRMKAPADRAPWIVLEETGAGFRVSTETWRPTYPADLGWSDLRCWERVDRAVWRHPPFWLCSLC